jgi:hypothetical protein
MTQLWIFMGRLENEAARRFSLYRSISCLLLRLLIIALSIGGGITIYDSQTLIQTKKKTTGFLPADPTVATAGIARGLAWHCQKRRGRR